MVYVFSQLPNNRDWLRVNEGGFKMDNKIRQAKQKSIFWGIVGGILLFSIFFIIVSVANSFSHSISEFTRLWYWISALTVGFGIQVGLYVHVRQAIQLKKQYQWRTIGVIIVFVVALFTKMYGFPLTIYVLSSIFVSNVGFNNTFQPVNSIYASTVFVPIYNYFYTEELPEVK